MVFVTTQHMPCVSPACLWNVVALNKSQRVNLVSRSFCSAGVIGIGWNLSYRASLVKCICPHLWSTNQCHCLQFLICRRKGWTSFMVKRYLVFPEFLFSLWSLCFLEHAVSCCFTLPHVLSVLWPVSLFVWRHEAAVSPLCVLLFSCKYEY